ncbi:MAG: ABC transporter permease [Acidaminococcaceae bacterium]|nr:ABC transporter permease [Acidaminococcaceae bacterium]MDD4721948.1 ABC transporter permease [Acidaminococcaceae bacterium]
MHCYGIQRYLQIMKREFLFLFKFDIRRIVVLFCAASAYLILFSLLYQQGTVEKIPALVLDQNNSALSREFVQYIEDNEKFHVIAEPINLETFQNKISRDRELVGFIIPPDFNMEAESGRSAKVLMVMEGSNLIITSTSAIAGLEMIRGFSNEKGVKLLEKNVSLSALQAAQKIRPVDFNYRIIGNKNLNYMYFLALGLSLAAFQQGIFIAIAAAFLYKPQGIMNNEIKLNWLARYAAKILPYFFISLVAYATNLFVAKYVFAYPIKKDILLDLFAIGAAFAFIIANIGGIVANLVHSELTFTRISLAYVVPAFILSGYTWPLEGMIKPIYWLAQLSPLTYLANTFREIILLGYSINSFHNSLILLIAGIIAFFLAAHLYDLRVKSFARSNACN